MENKLTRSGTSLAGRRQGCLVYAVRSLYKDIQRGMGDARGDGDRKAEIQEREKEKKNTADESGHRRREAVLEGGATRK